VVSVRKDQGLPPCQTQLLPDSSKINTSLAKAELISDAGQSSVITYLRKGKKCCTAAVREKSEKQCERNSSSDTKVTKKAEGGGAPGAGAKIPLQPVEKTMLPLQSMKDHIGADIQPAAHGTPHTRAGVAIFMSCKHLS